MDRPVLVSNLAVRLNRLRLTMNTTEAVDVVTESVGRFVAWTQIGEGYREVVGLSTSQPNKIHLGNLLYLIGHLSHFPTGVGVVRDLSEGIDSGETISPQVWGWSVIWKNC